MIKVLKQAYQLLLTEPYAPAVCDQLEVILRQAIAELESQEPDDFKILSDLLRHEVDRLIAARLAQRIWVGLTPEEILDMFDAENVYGSKWLEFARAVENKLKEKNS